MADSALLDRAAQLATDAASLAAKARELAAQAAMSPEVGASAGPDALTMA